MILNYRVSMSACRCFPSFSPQSGLWPPETEMGWRQRPSIDSTCSDHSEFLPTLGLWALPILLNRLATNQKAQTQAQAGNKNKHIIIKKRTWRKVLLWSSNRNLRLWKPLLSITRQLVGGWQTGEILMKFFGWNIQAMQWQPGSSNL